MISPLLSNLYLTEVDRMLEQAKAVTRFGKYTAIEYARFADDLVILVDAHPRHAWLLKAIPKRLREELMRLGVEVNEEKSRIVDLTRGERFGFLQPLKSPAMIRCSGWPACPRDELLDLRDRRGARLVIEVGRERGDVAAVDVDAEPRTPLTPSTSPRSAASRACGMSRPRTAVSASRPPTRG